MKKFLLLLFALLTFAKCSFAENWVWVSYETVKNMSFEASIDMDSIKIKNNIVEYDIRLIEPRTPNEHAIFHVIVDFDKNQCSTGTMDIFYGEKFVKTIDISHTDKLTEKDFNTLLNVYLKSMCKHQNELIKRDLYEYNLRVVITIESIILFLILFGFVIYLIRNKKIKIEDKISNELECCNKNR